MGQLPSSRVTPSPVFSKMGIDYAGPFLLKKGYTRKPVLIKTYMCIFVCFSTKAVHLEAASDLNTESFLATLKKFVSRRGLPTEIHSDNGSNFKGAANDLKHFYEFLSKILLNKLSIIIYSPLELTGYLVQNVHLTSVIFGRP